MATWYSIIQMCQNLTNTLWVGHLGCKPFLTIIDNAAVNILVYKSLCLLMIISSEQISRSRLFMLPFNMDHLDNFWLTSCCNKKFSYSELKNTSYFHWTSWGFKLTALPYPTWRSESYDLLSCYYVPASLLNFVYTSFNLHVTYVLLVFLSAFLNDETENLREKTRPKVTQLIINRAGI